VAEGVSRNIFRSRLARRVLLLFFASALAPVTLIGVLSFLQVAGNLREQSQRRIQQQAKASGMGIVERLLLLQADLDLAASQLGLSPSSGAGVASGLAAQLAAHFDGVALADPTGRIETTLAGEIAAPRPLSAEERDHLEADHTLIRILPAEGLMTRILLGRRVATPRLRGVVWGMADSEFLWGVGPKNPLPPSVELCILDDDGRMLIRSLAIPDDFPSIFASVSRNSIDRRLTWQAGGRSFLAGYWPISMRSNYLTPAWTVVVSEDRRLAMQPIADFRTTFPLVLLLSLWLVLLLSLIQIRRSLGPLQELREATSRIAHGDFGSRVAISSGDEFEVLGEDLNRMAGRLGSQFRSLSAHAAIGRAALAGPTTDELADATLGIVLGAFPSLCACLVVAEAAAVSRARAWLALGTDASPRTEKRAGDHVVDLTQLPDLAELSSGRTVLKSGTAARRSSEPLLGNLASELHAVQLIPLIADQRLLGVFALATFEEKELSDEIRQFAADLAGQLALAVQGATLRGALEAERHRLSRLVEHLPDGVLLLDRERRIVLANRVGRRLLPVLSTAAVGERVERLGDAELERLAPAGPGPRQEVIVENPERRVFTVATGEVGASTETASTVIVVREVTREREIEDQMQRQERLAAVGRLAAGIAHDFNNMLQGIVMAGEVIAMNSVLPEPLRRMARDVTMEGQRGAQLIRQILDFSRKTPSTREPVDLGGLMNELTRLLRRTIPENIEIAVEIEPGAHHVLADATRLQQVITNLALNSRDAMPEGGKIIFRLASLDVAFDRTSPIPDLPAGSWVKLDVIDTGPGIPEDVRPHVFEPFFSTKPAGQGTGLGLAQAYGIVSDHDGVIRFASSPGHGTTFTVILPRAEAEMELKASDAKAVALRGQARIMVVEDNIAVLRGIEQALRACGFRVTTVRNGREALAMWITRRREFDLVLTDAVMPEMDGIELSRALLADTPELPIILMSGYPLGHTADELDVLGVRAVLPKPFSLEVLSGILTKLLPGLATSAG